MKNKSKCIIYGLTTTLGIRTPVVNILVNVDSMFTFPAADVQRNGYSSLYILVKVISC